MLATRKRIQIKPSQGYKDIVTSEIQGPNCKADLAKHLQRQTKGVLQKHRKQLRLLGVAIQAKSKHLIVHTWTLR